METSGEVGGYKKTYDRIYAQSMKTIRRQHDERQVRRIQDIRLRTILKRAYQKCGYYRERFAQCGFDLTSLLERKNFQDLPLLTKYDLNLHLARIIAEDSSPLDLFKCSRGFTSGTTGVPVLVFFDRSAGIYSSIKLVQFFHNNQISLAPNSTAILNVVEFESLTSYYLAMPSLNNSYYYRINLSAPRWKDQQGLVDLIGNLKPAIIEGRPTPLGMLADVVVSFRPEQRVKPQAILSYGETLYDDARRRLSDSFGAEVYDLYGITELGGMVGLECKLHNGFHVYSENFLVEVIDPKGNVSSPGQVGEIVITSLVNKIMPIIRYRTGDRGSVSPNECGCGLAYPLLHLAEGRIVNLFVGEDGAQFNPYPLGLAVEKLPVLQYQIVQEDIKQVRIRYLPKADLSDGAWSEVLQKTREIMGNDCAVHIEKVDRFETGEKTLQKFLCRVNGQR